MKNYYLLLFLFIGLFGKAQIITIPDANFKAKLLAANSTNYIARNSLDASIAIDTNNNFEIEVSEALTVFRLTINTSNISSLEGINSFTNLKTLICNNNSLATLDVSNLQLLQDLNCNNNSLTTLDISNLQFLQNLNCNNNQLISLTNNNCPNLKTLNCDYNLLSSLNINNVISMFNISARNNQLSSVNLININSSSPLSFDLNLTNNNLQTLDISNLKVHILTINQNQNLISLNIKDSRIMDGFDNPYSNLFIGNPNLKYICADEGEINSINQYFQDHLIYIYPSFNCQVNSYCTFTPGGQFYQIQGQNKFDNENDGCDIVDGFIPNLKFNITNGTTTGTIISNNSGNYSIPVQAGTHTITPILENPSYFTVSPTNVVVNFPSQTSPFTQNFCITPNGVVHDVEVSIIPTGVARPGFDCNYKIIYKNKGNQIENGVISFQFNDVILDLVSSSVATSSQTLNNLNWIYSNLQPFETRSMNVVLNLNSSLETPAVNDGDFLVYIAEITQIGLDEVISDNSFGLKQIVVNSYDPNDKTCLQGNVVGPDKIGSFVHYMIRFENTGTFPAQNIVVKDMIDATKFDVSSLVPLHASHNYFTRINGNKVEFIFENINLPFDDANNDGYVSFKIKTLPTLVLGNTFSNSANIYFDYNFPIATNTASTTIVALSNPSFEFANYFSLYPNPTTNELNINLKLAIEINSIQIYNTLGQLITVQTGNSLKVDVSNLKTGNYFIKINTNEGYSTSQFMKE